MTVSRKAAAVVVFSAAALSLSACAKSDRGSGTSGSGGAGGNSDATLTFAAAGAPSTFDPFYASDGETFRITRQLFEGLVSFKPGTADLAPGLATSWNSSKDGKTWTFKLRTGVKFSDGTPFNAAAVCKNFERMDNQNDAGQSAAEYWATNMIGFKKSKDDLFQGCTAKGDAEVELKLLRATSKFPALLGLSSFSMQSPTAMDKYKANNISAQGEGFAYSEYAKSRPTGTGPFTFSSYDVANKTVTLVRNDNYWGDKAKVKKLVFQIIPDATQRKQALLAGQIDGYDLPAPVDWDSLKKAGMNLEVRPAFNILYLGLNAKKNPALKDLKVRQALYYAINREQLVKSQLPDGASVATQFYPKTVDGYSDGVTKYNYDPNKAKDLLKQAGQSNLTIDFWYPSEVSRPYMPDPQAIFQAIKGDWEKVGVKVKPVTKPWAGGYITGTQGGAAPAYLMGWTGDYNTPDNFLGSFFGSTKGQMDTGAYPWGTTLASDLAKDDSIVDPTQRTAAYKKLNEQIMSQWLPGLPISSSPPAVVFGKGVSGVVASPLTAEDFSTAVKK
ncbi:ABC transporter substrate-binding protein [Calidifontibacter sp. DB0510]|uniref:ABC transporter substrate-binding protein n=1 Tax=Metallococcus carri TaxID=1656884 RepID=A0A967AZ60_9MICO|nr:ABC transporter substrate-binding protein [Metallococcus carri]NHN55087.1 ABC transporter substrate-binding protein [Metallococcus carri]NOP36164.1 ABC transporter substrate-binding protein [Calidifontibacter sp. DB2511S]